jgi:WD40 repeat protein
MAAAVGIVLDTAANTQRFFGAGSTKDARGHSDDITALCIHPDRTLVATGEVGKNPKICVWDSTTMTLVSEFRQGRNSRAVTSLAFSKDGNYLASTALDNDHMVRVWNWNAKSKVFEEKGGPDKILDCCWSHEVDVLCTVGIKHVYFWSAANSWEKKKGIFGGKGEMVNMTTVQFVDGLTAVTGGTNGELYLWEDNKLTRTIKAHTSAVHTLFCDGMVLYSGGSDKKL